MSTDNWYRAEQLARKRIGLPPCSVEYIKMMKNQLADSELSLNTLIKYHFSYTMNDRIPILKLPEEYANQLHDKLVKSIQCLRESINESEALLKEHTIKTRNEAEAINRMWLSQPFDVVREPAGEYIQLSIPM